MHPHRICTLSTLPPLWLSHAAVRRDCTDTGTYCLIVDGERVMLTRTAADYELESGDLVEVAGKGAASAASKAPPSRAAAAGGSSNSTRSSSASVPARRMWSWNAGRRGFSAYDASTCAVINRSYERWVAAGR